MPALIRTSRRSSHVTVVASAFLILVGGCGVGTARQNAEALVEKYFRTAAADDPSGILDLYNGDFYAATPREQWRTDSAAIRGKLGKPIEHTLAGWQARSNIGTGGTGYFVLLTYDVKYEHATGQETFAIFIPAVTGVAGISGHHFESSALLR